MSWSDEVKAPNVAGGFYPSNPKELSLMIDGFLNAASVEELSDIVALVSPHAGYQYSGQVAAYGYKAIKGKKYSTVIVLAPSHYVGFPGISVWGSGKFRTPLGDIPVDSELVARLIKENPQISFIAEAFLKEHSLEVQLPFLQKALTDFKIVPIVMGQLNFKDCQRFADTLTNTVGDRKDILVVASTDLSHFHPANEAQMLDRQTLNYLSQFDAKLLWENSSKYDPSVCGLAPIISTLLYAQAPGDKNIKILKYAHSGDVTGDLSSVVGYVSAAIYKSDNPKGANNMLTTEQRKKLLEIARQSLETFVKTGKRLDFSTNDPVLKKVSGAFVTLKEHNDLRGCIGRIVGDLPLYQVIPQMAIEAGTGDPRFHPVKEADLKDLEYEISVLSPLEKITDINRIQVGTHGIIIRKGFNSGLLLPQVATEYGWDRITFLEQTCRKAGLPADAYKSGAEITIFSAEVFSEKSP
ncbi:MAG: AmmeMemoRadiSam system protein B [Candidatus Omnitrophota bacterium]|nr:AmmeMemoRadiSam system protein B [Candidatus Omnitrophota bacterium]